LAISVDEHWTAATLVHCIYPGDKCRCLIRLIPDSDGVGLSSNTFVADVDIVIARSEVIAGITAYCDIEAAGCA
jgi:hypothetical protein